MWIVNGLSFVIIMSLIFIKYCIRKYNKEIRYYDKFILIFTYLFIITGIIIVLQRNNIFFY